MGIHRFGSVKSAIISSFPLFFFFFLRRTGSWDRSVHISFVPVHYAEKWLPQLQHQQQQQQQPSASPGPVQDQPSVSPRSLPRQLSQTGPGAALAQLMSSAPGQARVLKSPSGPSLLTGAVPAGGGHVRQKSKTDDSSQPPAVPPPIAAPPSMPIPTSLPPPIVSPRAVAGTVPAPVKIAIPPPLPTFHHDVAADAGRFAQYVQEYEGQLVDLHSQLGQLSSQVDQVIFAARQNPDPSNVAYWRASLEELHKKEVALGDKVNEVSSQLTLARQQLRLSQLTV
jgi:hypothetical protein